MFTLPECKGHRGIRLRMALFLDALPQHCVSAEKHADACAQRYALSVHVVLHVGKQMRPVGSAKRCLCIQLGHVVNVGSCLVQHDVLDALGGHLFGKVDADREKFGRFHGRQQILEPFKRLS